MPAVYSGKCQDGRNLPGTAKWTPAEIKEMDSIQLAQALAEIREFARYYTANYYIHMKRLDDEIQSLLSKYQKARRSIIAMGILAALFTVLWIVLAVIPAYRFSFITMLLAVFTFFSIIILIPILFWFISTQGEYSKRHPKALAKLEKLNQAQEKELFGKYADYLITGFVLTPEYCLSEAGLDYMIKALNSHRASDLKEASALCRKKLGPSPVPGIIVSLNAPASRTDHAKRILSSTPKTVDLSQMESQAPDLRSVLQLSDYLHSALQEYASQNTLSQVLAEGKESLTMDEQELISNFRSLSENEKTRIRRVIHSLMSSQY